MRASNGAGRRRRCAALAERQPSPTGFMAGTKVIEKDLRVDGIQRRNSVAHLMIPAADHFPPPDPGAPSMIFSNSRFCGCPAATAFW